MKWEYRAEKGKAALIRLNKASTIDIPAQAMLVRFSINVTEEGH